MFPVKRMKHAMSLTFCRGDSLVTFRLSRTTLDCLLMDAFLTKKFRLSNVKTETNFKAMEKKSTYEKRKEYTRILYISYDLRVQKCKNY